MADLPAMPTADHVAAALVAAARVYEADAEAVFLRWPAGPAKFAACAALCMAFPLQSRDKLAGFLNHRKAASLAGQTRTYLATSPFWWKHEAVNAALNALGRPAVTPEEAAAPRPSRARIAQPGWVVDDRPPPPSLRSHFVEIAGHQNPRPEVPHAPTRSSRLDPPIPDVAPRASVPDRPKLRDHWEAPPVQSRARESVTAGLCGDPAPGQSALEQGYRPGSGLVAERKESR